MPPRKRKAPSAEPEAEPTPVPSSRRQTKAAAATKANANAAAGTKTKSAKSAKAASASEQPPVPVPPKRTAPNLVHSVVAKAQVNEAFHTKYIKELHTIYAAQGHDNFIPDYRRTIQQLMRCDDNQPFANAGLKFLAKFATSYNTEDTHPLLAYTFNWLLDTVSVSPNIRFRICQFVNHLLNALSNDAALDDAICDNILKYMMARMKDVAATVRVQALNAMQRLQMPDNPNDPIVKIYQHHLNSDPSPLVRQAVITSIGRNLHTIPFILDRFWDVDGKVRRHAYLHMCTYSVKSYKVVQRLQFIEQGLNDQCESVRKVVTNVLIPAWLQSYNRDFIQFVAALKLDASEADIERFRTAARLVLGEIFKKQSLDNLIAVLPLHTVDSDPELSGCIRLDRLTVESSLYWHCLIEFVANRTATHDDDDDLERIQPELTTFCAYMRRYFERTNAQPMDKWQKLEHHYILLTLCEIIETFDLSDELGRSNLRQLLCEMLASEEFEESIVAKLIGCLERVVPVADERLQLVADTVRTVLDTGDAAVDLSSAAVVELLARDSNLNLQVSSLKLHLMELEEQERVSIQHKEYGRAEQLREAIGVGTEELAALVAQHLSVAAGTGDAVPQARRVSNQEITRCVQMAYHVVRSATVRSLNPAIVRVFKDFIRRQMECQHMYIRDQALRCAVSFAMLYDQLAKDVYNELFVQFFKHQNSRIWATALSGMFELIDRYGFEHFEQEQTPSETGESEVTSATSTSGVASSLRTGGGKSGGAKSTANTTTRQLYSKATEDGDEAEDEEEMLMRRRNTDTMYMFDHFLDDCSEPLIQQALIDGYCRLLLRSHISGANYVSRMLLKYFNPMTEPEITQMLGIFFEKLVTHKRQECLQEAMFTTLFTVLESPLDSPLQEVQPEAILRFVITSTQPASCSPGLHIHNTIAMSFLDVMSENTENKELLRLLAKATLTLEVSDDQGLRRDLLCGLDSLLQGGHSFEARTEANMRAFKLKLESAGEQQTGRDGRTGSSVGGGFSSTANAKECSRIAEEGEEEVEDEEGAAEDQDGETAEGAGGVAEANATALELNDSAASDKAAAASTKTGADALNTTTEPFNASLTSTPVRSRASTSNQTLPDTPSSASPSKSPSQLQRSPLSPRSSPAAAAAAGKTAAVKSMVQPVLLAAPSTPTTYGLQNSTRTRSLRRSMHVAQSQSQDSSSSASANEKTSRRGTTAASRKSPIVENGSSGSSDGVDENVQVQPMSSRSRRAEAADRVQVQESQPKSPVTTSNTRTRRAAAAAAASTPTTSETPKIQAAEQLLRGKRRNEMVAKSPNSLRATVSKQTTKRSRITASPPTSPAPASPAAVRRTPVALLNVSVLMSPMHTNIIDHMLLANEQSTNFATATASASGSSPNKTKEPIATAAAAAASPSSSTSNTRRSSSRSTLSRHSSIHSTGSPSKKTAPATVATTASARKSPVKSRIATGTAGARSGLPLRNGLASTRPTTVPAPTKTSAPLLPPKYPTVKLHRLGHTRSITTDATTSSRSNATATAAATLPRHRTRGATVEEYIKNNIITRNRRSGENILSLTTQLNRSAVVGGSAAAGRSSGLIGGGRPKIAGGGGQATVTKPAGSVAASTGSPLRSSNRATSTIGGRGTTAETAKSSAASRGATETAAATQSTQQSRIPAPRSTRIPRPMTAPMSRK